MMDDFPQWIKMLEYDDWQFIRRFILASGSLKEMAKQYGVSYPTVRSRLDRLISKVEAAEKNQKSDEFTKLVSVLVADAQIEKTVARKLISTHKKTIKKESQDV